MKLGKKELIVRIESGEDIEIRSFNFEVIRALSNNWRMVEAFKLATANQQHLLIKDLDKFNYIPFAEIMPYIKPEIWKADAYRLLLLSAKSLQFTNFNKYLDLFKEYIKYINCNEVGVAALDKLEASRDINEKQAFDWILRLILTAAPMGES